jgi:hypothetical protein
LLYLGYLCRELAFIREFIINSAASDSTDPVTRNNAEGPTVDTEPHEVLMRAVNAVRKKYRCPIAVFGS